MKAIKPQQYSEGKLPVFVFPTSLEFYYDDQSSHKQVLTLYNPYEFLLEFKVLCNNPARYSVLESEGVIKPQCCIDIVIRATDVKVGAARDDKFRIHLYEHGVTKLLGQKDIPSHISLSESEGASRKSASRKNRNSNLDDVDEIFLRQPTRRESVVIQRSLPSIPVALISVACIIVLMLPTVGEGSANPSIPPYLYLSTNQKLIAAYILGLVTMAVLRN